MVSDTLRTSLLYGPVTDHTTPFVISFSVCIFIFTFCTIIVLYDLT